MKGSDGKLSFSDNERGKVCNDYMEMIVNDENYWFHNVEGDAVEGPVILVGRVEMLQALNVLKTGKAPGPSEVSLELIAASSSEAWCLKESDFGIL